MDETQDLKRTVAEILVAWRLGQHCTVSVLTTKCAKILTAAYEDELESAEDADISPSSVKWQLIDSLVLRLQTISRLAQIYSDVLEFIRVHDLISFEELFGSNKSRSRAEGRRKKLDWPKYELLEMTLRQAIILLCELNRTSKQGGEATSSDGPGFVQLSAISKLEEISFSRYLISLEDSLCTEQPVNDAEILRNLLEDPTLSNSEFIRENLQSDWFNKFVASFLTKPYHLDRFAILTSLWIIATQCQHTQLEQLMCELCDQVFHQEANSCQLEELLQLTQTGSFWLTQMKRFKATFKRANFSPSFDLLDEEILNDDELSLEDDEDHRSDGSSLSSVRLDNYSNEGNAATSDEKFREQEKLVDFNAKLRRLVDKELLIGSLCCLCGREPSGQLLEPVQLNLTGCPDCGIRICTDVYCSGSFKPFPNVSITNLTSSGKSTGRNHGQSILVASSNEWASKSLSASLEDQQMSMNTRSKLQRGQQKIDQTTSDERIEIKETFQRLTVLRGSRDETEDDESITSVRSGGSESEALRSYPNDPSSEHDVESDQSRSSQELDLSDEQNQQPSQCLNIVDEFMRARLKLSNSSSTGADKADKSDWAQISHRSNSSETLQLMSFAKMTSRGETGELVDADGACQVICASDLFVCDSLKNQSVDLRLHTKRRPRLFGGRHSEKMLYHNLDASIDYDLIYACKQRSLTSQLWLGCGRFYSQLEMIRSTGFVRPLSGVACEGNKPGVSTSAMPVGASSLDCPHCGCRLLEIESGLNLSILDVTRV